MWISILFFTVHLLFTRKSFLVKSSCKIHLWTCSNRWENIIAAGMRYLRCYARLGTAARGRDHVKSRPGPDHKKIKCESHSLGDIPAVRSGPARWKRLLRELGECLNYLWQPGSTWWCSGGPPTLVPRLYRVSTPLVRCTFRRNEITDK